MIKTCSHFIQSIIFALYFDRLFIIQYMGNKLGLSWTEFQSKKITERNTSGTVFTHNRCTSWLYIHICGVVHTCLDQFYRCEFILKSFVYKCRVTYQKGGKFVLVLNFPKSQLISLPCTSGLWYYIAKRGPPSALAEINSCFWTACLTIETSGVLLRTAVSYPVRKRKRIETSGKLSRTAVSYRVVKIATIETSGSFRLDQIYFDSIANVLKTVQKEMFFFVNIF